MKPEVFAVALALGAGALALWTDVRVPRIAPQEMRGVVLHAMAAFVVLHFVAGAVGPLSGGTLVMTLVAMIGIALPGLGYAFLASIWAIRMFHGAYAGMR
jgi:hypothetical protein